MKILLPDGIPKLASYKIIIKSPEFMDLAAFSAKFLTENRKFLSNYSKRWVSNPLQQWSRKWEYPFVISGLSKTLSSRNTVKVLDAGSGISFFPYFIQSKYPASEIYCTDQDPRLEKVYQKINHASSLNIQYARNDLRSLHYESGVFDIVYCISVLEHTNSYREIIEEFKRILKPEGKLIITFDISLDGKRDISIDKSVALFNLLADEFEIDRDISLDLLSLISSPDNLTTVAAKTLDADSLPWKAPAFIYQLQSLFKGKGYSFWPPLLTVFCLTLTKRR